MNENKKCPQCGTQIDDDAPEGLCPACLMKAGLRTSVPTVIAEPRPSNNTFQPPPGVPLGIEQVRKLFPQLEIIEQIGRGGMGVVFKARQPQLDRIVALKILPAELANTPGFAERFTREARALAKLNHPNIVSVFDFGQQEGLFYFIMEFVDGANLRQMIASKQMTPESALAIVPKICEALQFAHDEGILHRDIKPENILIDKKGRVKIADFGLAKITGMEQADHTLTVSGMSMGTPRYMAPEQFTDTKSVDHRADIYSLGVVFYEMLTGELPMGRFALPSKKVQVDVRIDEVVLHSLEKEPEQRYQHVSEIKTDVENITQHAVRAPLPIPSASVAARVEPRPPSEDMLEKAKKSLKNASVGMLVAGCLVLSWAVLGCIIDAWPMMTGKGGNPAVAVRVVLTMLFYLYAGILMMISSGSIKDLRYHRFNLGVCWMAMLLPISLIFLKMDVFNRMVWGVGFGALFGFQAYRALRKSDIIAAFEAAKPKLPMIGKDGDANFQSLEKPKSGLGLLSLWLAITGMVLPIVIVVVVLASGTAESSGFMILCGLLATALELAALVCGIIARRSASGKAGLIISCIGLILASQAFMALSTKGHRSGGGTFVETFGEAVSAAGAMMSSQAVITEDASAGDDALAGRYRTFRYRVTGPANHRATFWVEWWRDGVLDKRTGLTYGRWEQLPRGKGFDGSFEYVLADGAKAGPDSVGKMRWDFSVDSRVRNVRTTNSFMKVNDSRASTGNWIADPFAGIGATATTWGKTGRWAITPGEVATVLILRGGDSIQSASNSEDVNIAKKHKICMMLKARFDPVPESELKDWVQSTSLNADQVEKLQSFAKPSAATTSDTLEVEKRN